MNTNGTVRIAAVADLHYAKPARGSLQPLIASLAGAADVLLLCGDLTHHGKVVEAEALIEELTAIRIPIVAVLGNHDFHAGEQEQIEQALETAGVRVLDGDTVEIAGVGFAGVKGFGGGFGRYVLEPWGEALVKQFARESVEEALKLDSALARLTTAHRVVLLHYAPIPETVEGEPPEIWSFLGSGRLEEPINRFRVTAVFHGHAHHGRSEGRTSQGIPVYNVSQPLMRSTAPEGAPFRLLELTAAGTPA